MLNSLVELAQKSSDDQRHELVEHVTDLFATRAKKNRQEEIQVYNALLEGVLGQLPEASKQIISDRLATIDSTSEILAVNLAKDEAPIAGPMLQKSFVLKDQHLLEIAETMGKDHLMAVSRRNYLSPRLTRKLLEKGDDEVKSSVAANLGADISSAELEETIKNLPEQLGEKIRHLRKSTEDMIQELFRDFGDAMTGQPLSPRPRRMSPQQWMAAIGSGKSTLSKAVSQLCSEKNLYDAAFLISAATGIEFDDVCHFMARYDATATSIMCRAVGITDTDYAAVCKTRCAHLKFPATTGSKWQTNYHMLEQEEARKLISLLKAKLKTTKKPAVAA